MSSSSDKPKRSILGAFGKLKGAITSLAAQFGRSDRDEDDEPESFDHPRPKRVNPDPPKRDWFARVEARSLRARAVADARKLEAADDEPPRLSRDASASVDRLFEKTMRSSQAKVDSSRS